MGSLKLDETKINLTLNRKDHSLSIHCEQSINWVMSAVQQAIRKVKDFHPKYNPEADFHNVNIELSLDLLTHEVIPYSAGCPNEDWYLGVLHQTLESLLQESRYNFAMLKQAQAMEQARVSGLLDVVAKNVRKN